MTRYLVVTLGLLGFAVSGALVGAQSVPQHSPDWPDWAYGLLEPIGPDSRMAPPCPPSATPMDCAYIGPPVPENGIELSLPGSDRTFTRNEAYYNWGPADWYPEDHPEMPEVVAHGKRELEVRACSLCHYPNGQGKMENAHTAGLPEAYILQQLEAFATGQRRSADIRKANTNEMAKIARNLTEAERKEVAAYFSSMPFRPYVRVVEAEEAPQVDLTSNGLMTPKPDGSMMPLGQRIIEVPEHPERTADMRDPRSGFVSYVPVGSVAKGRELATTGGGGRTMQCNICHGPELKGVANVPGIAGRTASYLMRQLWDIKQGTRKSLLMTPVVAKLSADDMLNIVAYVASQEP